MRPPDHRYERSGLEVERAAVYRARSPDAVGPVVVAAEYVGRAAPACMRRRDADPPSVIVSVKAAGNAQDQATDIAPYRGVRRNSARGRGGLLRSSSPKGRSASIGRRFSWYGIWRPSRSPSRPSRNEAATSFMCASWRAMRTHSIVDLLVESRQFLSSCEKYGYQSLSSFGSAMTAAS